MKTVGLLGGMSWESTAVYYRLINEGVRAAHGGLASAPLLIHSFDFSEIVAQQKAGDWAGAARVLGQAGAGLAKAGADALLICTNTMHAVARDVEHFAGIPLIDIIDETAARLRADGRRRPLLLGTQYTMEHGFYASRMHGHGLDLMVPCQPRERARIHAIIFDELCQGKILTASRRTYLDTVERALAAGADSVILGCTEIGLLIDPADLPLPGYDTTAIHAAAAVRYAGRP